MQPPAATGIGEFLIPGLLLLASIAIIGNVVQFAILVLRPARSSRKRNKRRSRH